MSCTGLNHKLGCLNTLFYFFLAIDWTSFIKNDSVYYAPCIIFQCNEGQMSKSREGIPRDQSPKNLKKIHEWKIKSHSTCSCVNLTTSGI